MKSRIGATQSMKKLDIRKSKSSEPGLFRAPCCADLVGF